MAQREQLVSRLGFLFMSAGCAIGLGNVWRFPYITGKNGGAVFLLVYLLFLFCMGMPVLIMEFSVGRASRSCVASALVKLEPEGARWHKFGVFSFIGSYLLMMFYIPIAGWMLYYCWLMLSGGLSIPPDQMTAVFGSMLENPGSMLFWAVVVAAICFAISGQGIQRGVERVVKIMMCGLLVIIIGLAVRALTLPGSLEGFVFYLAPDLGRAADVGFGTLINEAMNQAFFTLGLGIGSMGIFASHLGREHTLLQESIFIVCLDLFVAFTAGLIIFPACFAFGVQPNEGTSLVFVTLPNVFNSMAGGRFYGTCFFVFMSFAAMTTVVTVMENVVSYSMDMWGWSRNRSTIVNYVVLTLCTLPCILGFNVLAGIQPLGKGTCIMDLEDFLISNNILPLGAFLYILFCTRRNGWGWDNFLAEANTGKGLKLSKFLRFYLSWILPVVVAIIFIAGYVQKFFV